METCHAPTPQSLRREHLSSLERYTGQPSPGAGLPIPHAPGGHPVPFGLCSCRRPADAIIRRTLGAQDEPICATCAERAHVPDVIDLAALDRLPDAFRTEEAMRSLQWKGTGIALARQLQARGFYRDRDPSGFIWRRRLAA